MKPWLCLIGLGLLVVATVSSASANPPSCSLYFPSDPGCIFADTFETITNSCPAAYGCSGGWVPPGTAAPGLNGTGAKAVLQYPNNVFPQNGGLWIDSGVPCAGCGSNVITPGEVIWSEYWLSFEAGFTWTDFGQGSYEKTFELNSAKCDGLDSGGRHLFLIQPTTTNIPGNTNGIPSWAVYTNTVCPNGHGNLAGSIRGDGEGYDTRTTGSQFRFQSGGTEYHIVNEIKYAQNTTGYIKTYINGALVINAQGIRTLGDPSWDIIRFGGIADQSSGKRAYYDEARVTRTNLTPGGPILNPPANPKVCRGAGCTPAFILPVPVLAAGLIWLRRWLKRNG